MTKSKSKPTSPSSLRLATTYFVFTFSTGFTLGTIRQLLLVQILHFPTSRAKILEAPFMLLAVLFWSHYLITHYHIPRISSLRLQIGVLALCIMVSFLKKVMGKRY